MVFYVFRRESERCSMGTEEGVKGVLWVQRRECKVFCGYSGGNKRCLMGIEEEVEGVLWVQRRDRVKGVLLVQSR